MRNILFLLLVSAAAFGIYKYMDSNDHEANDVSSDEIEMDGDDYIDENGNYVMVLNDTTYDCELSCESDTSQPAGMEKLLRIKEELQNKRSAVNNPAVTEGTKDRKQHIKEIIDQINEDLPAKFKDGMLSFITYFPDNNSILLIFNYSIDDLSMPAEETFDIAYRALFMAALETHYDELLKAHEDESFELHFVFKESDWKEESFEVYETW